MYVFSQSKDDSGTHIFFCEGSKQNSAYRECSRKMKGGIDWYWIELYAFNHFSLYTQQIRLKLVAIDTNSIR